MEVLPLAEEWADQAKDARGYKVKKDGNVALVGVASLPREMEDDFPEFAEVTLKFLKEKYGDRLKSVVVHDDEPHPHLHFTVIPRKGERFDDIHEGLKAKNEAKKNNQKGKAQNLAYVGAMQKLQDEFHNKVGIKTGLTRIGPGRRRLTRDAWQAEQKSKRRLLPMRKLLQLLAIVLVSKSQGRSYRDRRPSPRESEGVRGQDVRLVLWSSRWLARAKRESQGRGYQGQG